MNKFSLYVLLVLVFLGLSRSFSLAEKGTLYIKNKQILGNYFDGQPIAVILIDSFQTGFLIKTYYHKYKIIYGFKQPRILTVRTSIEFNRENASNIGMEIFRRGETPNSESTLPMPPGMLFVGNPAYGQWVLLDSGQKIWIFHRTYRHFGRILGWGDWRPTYEFYEKARLHLGQERPFYGLKNEFGTQGMITKRNFPEYFHKSERKSITIREFIRKLTKPHTVWNNA